MEEKKPDTGTVMGIATKSSERAPMDCWDAIVIDKDSGPCGEHRGSTPGRQVTILTNEGWQNACKALGRELDWTTRRANLLIRDIDLKNSIGKRLAIGHEVQLEITTESTPCERMDEQCEGLRMALQPDWRGGVSCKVLRGGVVRKGDMVSFAGVEES